MNWLKDKALALLRWARDTIAYWYNYSIDLPPMHAKAFFWVVVGLLVLGWGLRDAVGSAVSHPVAIPAADYLFGPPVPATPVKSVSLPELPTAAIEKCPDHAGELETLRRAVADKTAEANGKAERVTALEAQVATLKARLAVRHRRKSLGATEARADFRLAP